MKYLNQEGFDEFLRSSVKLVPPVSEDEKRNLLVKIQQAEQNQMIVGARPRFLRPAMALAAGAAIFAVIAGWNHLNKIQERDEVYAFLVDEFLGSDLESLTFREAQFLDGIE